jgi:hypothetical protein
MNCTCHWFNMNLYLINSLCESFWPKIGLVWPVEQYITTILRDALQESHMFLKHLLKFYTSLQEVTNNNFIKSLYKGCNSKNAYFENFVFIIYQLNTPPIFKICVSIPHNYPLIMGVRHKNFKDWMNIELWNYKTKIFKICAFAVTPFVYIVKMMQVFNKFPLYLTNL